MKLESQSVESLKRNQMKLQTVSQKKETLRRNAVDQQKNMDSFQVSVYSRSALFALCCIFFTANYFESLGKEIG